MGIDLKQINKRVTKAVNEADALKLNPTGIGIDSLTRHQVYDRMCGSCGHFLVEMISGEIQTEVLTTQKAFYLTLQYLVDQARDQKLMTNFGIAAEKLKLINGPSDSR